MGLFRHKHDTIDASDTIDLTDTAVAAERAQATESTEQHAGIHAGVPGRCPTCDGFGYIDHIDMIHKYQRQHCRACGHVWEFTFDEAGDVLDVTDIEAGSLERSDFGIQL